jgi:large subunit ribosomal protein L41
MQPTQALLKRFRKLPLTTKDIKKGYYKGTRTGAMGRHTKYGGYIIDWSRVRTYVVPAGLDAFKVRGFQPIPPSCRLGGSGLVFGDVDGRGDFNH